ncbi:unnamed protein product, partial [Symbiodinium necroappetens]
EAESFALKQVHLELTEEGSNDKADPDWIMYLDLEPGLLKIDDSSATTTSMPVMGKTEVVYTRNIEKEIGIGQLGYIQELMRIHKIPVNALDKIPISKELVAERDATSNIYFIIKASGAGLRYRTTGAATAIKFVITTGIATAIGVPRADIEFYIKEKGSQNAKPSTQAASGDNYTLLVTTGEQGGDRKRDEKSLCGLMLADELRGLEGRSENGRTTCEWGQGRSGEKARR